MKIILDFGVKAMKPNFCWRSSSGSRGCPRGLMEMELWFRNPGTKNKISCYKIGVRIVHPLEVFLGWMERGLATPFPEIQPS